MTGNSDSENAASGAKADDSVPAARRRGCLGKSCCGCGVGAAVLVALFLIMSMVSARSSRPVADAFLTAIRDGDDRRAFDLTSDAFQKTNTVDNLTTITAGLEKAVGPLVAFQHLGLFTNFNIFSGATTVRHDYAATFAQDPGKASVILVRENLRWFVLGYNFESPKIAQYLKGLMNADLKTDDTATTR